MPRLRRLSGAELVRIFRGFGFAVHSQRGSHIKLRRILPDGASQTLTVPAHEAVKLGTLHAVVLMTGSFGLLYTPDRRGGGAPQLRMGRQLAPC